ncbi:hypothetical protein ACVDG8_037350 (plasmid) [Mesorhizobium sp. ORM8.1]
MAVVGLSLVNSILDFSGVSSQYSTAIAGIILIVVLSVRAISKAKQ